MIVIYADESGTHDQFGMQPNTQYPIIAGFAARKSTWDKFCVAWKAVLKKYDAPFFHARELEGARLAIVENRKADKKLLKNPYYKLGWDLKTISSFQLSLAKVAASDNKIPVASCMNIVVFNKMKEGFQEKYSYRHCMDEFFAIFRRETELQWGNFKKPVEFVFDQNEDNEEWSKALQASFDDYKKTDSRSLSLKFGDKKCDVTIPLQAADMLAYHVRKFTNDLGKVHFGQVDRILLKNLIKSAMIRNPDLRPLMKTPQNWQGE